MSCPAAPEGYSSASRGRIGVTELALLTAHERECADCRKEQPSASIGSTRGCAGLAGWHPWRPTFLTSAHRASARAIASFRLGATRLGRLLAGIVAGAGRPLAHVPEAAAAVTTRLARLPVRDSARAAIEGARAGVTRALDVIVLLHGLLPVVWERCRKAAACAIVSSRSAAGRFADLLTRTRESWTSTTRRAVQAGGQWTRVLLTPDTRFLLRICAGIASLGILGLALIFVWPRQSPDKMTARPPAVAETSEAVSAPPSIVRPPAPPEAQKVTKATRRSSPAPQPEPFASARNPAREIVREGAAPDAPDPSAAIDWLLKGADGTSRQ